MSTKLPAVILADFTTSLATALAVGATTATLQSNVDDDGITLPDGLVYFSLDGSNSSKEHIQAVKTGANLASIYSVSRQGTLTSGTARAHRLGASVTLTDFATIKYMNDLLKGSTSLDSTAPLKYDGVADMTGDTNKIASVKYVNDTAIAGAPDASTTTKGITKMSVAPVSAANPIAVGDNDPRVPTQGENDALVGTSGTPSSSNKYVTNDDTTGTGSIYRASSFSTIFGGNGSDGALSISSGTTTIDCANQDLIVKNYTSISITGTGALTFINPGTNGTIVVLKSQGAVTLTSSTNPHINLKGLGGAGGTGGTDGTNASGTNGINGFGYTDETNHYGIGGAGGAGGGAGGIIYTNRAFYTISQKNIYRGDIYISTGAGGAGGGSTNTSGGGAGGDGGRGGGALYIQCGGALTFSGYIDVSGANGSNAGTGSANKKTSGGGGGGATGMAVILYNSLISNTGTITAVGGNGGNGGAGSSGGPGSGAGGGGGGGGSYYGAGGNGANAGSNGSNGGGLGAGAGGGAGYESLNAATSGGTGGSSAGGLITQNLFLL